MTGITGSENLTVQELGIKIGRFKRGKYNSITDVKGVKIGHVTHIKDNVDVPGINEKSCVRSGITLIIPCSGNIYKRRLVAGGFVLNGIGEVTGLTQVREWGWLETPILLTNTMSIGAVHSGIVNYMIKANPDLGIQSGVIIPVIGETDDSYLNDVRIPSVTEEDVPKAIKEAKTGYLIQGSVGAGTGMSTLGFAGGIGTSSRVLPEKHGEYTIGVLVLSNFGNLINFRINGCPLGEYLVNKKGFSKSSPGSYGSIIVVIGTDAPFLSSQLTRIAKRAALGVGRAGSYAASTSGEIMIAFSTGNRVLREEAGKEKYLRINFISDSYINPFYEAVIEATEEAILNSIFCSKGMNGRKGHYSPPVPSEIILKLLRKDKVF
ncbi:P1 family peptidase [Candidatus Woesearchaeota archaeon]|nr:P1 family peptidase [Candidatus Woesearchaeota archaeon]